MVTLYTLHPLYKGHNPLIFFFKKGGEGEKRDIRLPTNVMGKSWENLVSVDFKEIMEKPLSSHISKQHLLISTGISPVLEKLLVLPPEGTKP